MRVAFLADVHGNRLALEACLGALEAERVSRIFFLGDAVGYFPDAAAVIDLLAHAGAFCQQGNHEAMLLGTSLGTASEVVTHIGQTARALDAETLHRIAGWPTTRSLDLQGRRLLCVHGSPADPLDGRVYPDTDLDPLGPEGPDVVLMAHTHRPFVREAAGRVYVNVGSVGLPRDRGDRGSFGLYDTDIGAFEILRFPIDRGAVAKTYGGLVHESVLDCLLRRSASVVGREVP